MNNSSSVYSISDLSREFSVTPRALRFYEDKGLIAPRREGLTRIYGARDRKRLKIILQCKKLGFPLSDIKEMIDLYDNGGNPKAQVDVALAKYSRRLAELKAQQSDISFALAETERAIARLQQRQPAFGDLD